MRLRDVPGLIREQLINGQEDSNPGLYDFKAHTVSIPQWPPKLRGQRAPLVTPERYGADGGSAGFPGIQGGTRE